MAHPLPAEPEYSLADAERIAIWIARASGRRVRLVWDATTHKYQVRQTSELVGDWIIQRARKVVRLSR